MVRMHLQPPELAKEPKVSSYLSRRLRRLRRPRRRVTALFPRLLLGLPHPTDPPRLPRRRALAPKMLHLGGECRQPRDPRETPCRRTPARRRQQDLLFHLWQALLLQQRVPQIHCPWRSGRVYPDRLLPGLLGRHLRPLPAIPTRWKLQDRLPAEVDGEIPDLHGLEEMRAVWENRRESRGLQPHSVSIEFPRSPV